jgi:uncharacterized protein YggT (Ycf19 family)
MEPLEPPTYVPPFQPLERTAPIQPVAPVQLAQPLPSTQPVQRSPGVSVAERAAQITYLVLGVVEALIITRVILKLLAANLEAGFVRFVYAVSAPLVAPFQGIFPTPVTQNNVLEFSALVAMAVYAVIAWALARLIVIVGQRQSIS